MGISKFLGRDGPGPAAIFNVLAGTLALGLAITQSAASGWAAGFAIKEQSATSQGNSFAGVSAGGEDISAMAFNPASIALYPGTRATLSVTKIHPDTKVSNARGRTAGGAETTGPADAGGVADDAIVPAFYASWQADDSLFLAIAATAPFGLSSEYPDAWQGRYHATESKLRSFEAAPTLAWRPLPQLALGAGLRIQYFDAKLKNAIDTSSLAGVAFNPANDSDFELEGDDWALGYSFGAVFLPSPTTRLGLAYRSRINHKLDGEADFTRSALGDVVNEQTQVNGKGLLADSAASAKITTPDSLSLGFVQELGPAWSVMGEAAWTGWSSFETLRVRFENPDQPDSVTEQDWDDSWFLSLGSSYRPSENWVLRAGVAYDQSPVPDDTRNPRIPDADRYWVSLGATWQLDHWLELNAGYSHIFMSDSKTDLTLSDNQTRGALSADYESDIDIFAISLSMKF